MAVHPHGKVFDPDTMFREMHGREGTPLWRMRQWCRERGFEVVSIRLEKEAVVTMLEAGVPLIGTLEGPFNSHVDVVCGYNDDLDTLYVRDPGHWAPIAWPWAFGLSRYVMHAGLLAVIDAREADLLALAQTWRSDECDALLDLSQAVAQGELEAAEAAYARIADDSPAASMRDGYAVNVAIGPVRFRERMQALSEDEQAPGIARFRAIMSLGSDEADTVLTKLLEDSNADQFRAGARRYLRLLKMMNNGDWSTANRLIDLLLVTGGSIARFWELKSDIQAELGNHDASREALERAIELEPLRISTREKALSRSASRLTHAEYTQQLEALLAEDPSDKGLLLNRAALLQDGPDGRAYEAAAREALRWFPRFPGAYFSMLNWYEAQGRKDLHEALLEKARAMLPDIFTKPDPASAGDQPPTEPTDALPDSKPEVLDLVWKLSDPRREAALAQAIQWQEAGQLHWHEVARLVACRLLVADRQDAELTDADQILPDPPPGAPHWFAAAVCDLVTEYKPSIRTALAIDHWLLRVVPNLNNYAELWFDRVILLEHAHQYEKALEELRKLLERYPATSSALYRMGVVKFRQQDYQAARGYLESALQVNPGLYGAMNLLREVYQTLGQREDELRCTRMLRHKFPYSVPYLRDEVLAVAELESSAAAERLLAEVNADFPPRRLDVLRARLLLAANQTDDAAALMSPWELSPEDDDDSFEECLLAKLQLAQARKDSAEVLALCAAGAARWPDSTRLKELEAEHRLANDPARSQALLREVLCHGEPRAQTAWQYLQIADRPPDESARDAVLAAPEDRRQELAELFAEVTSYTELLRWNEPFLSWALQQFPESDTLRYQLIMHCNMNGQAARAVRLAEELHRRNPEHPEATRILGRCLIDHDAKRALPYLEEVCRQNRSAVYLFDLARCHQCVGNVHQSQDLHWEILDQNPYASASWTNLYFIGAPRQRLWPYLTPMLERGYGVDGEYFEVAAVKIALELRELLPATWFPLATQRWAALQIHPGFQDEKQRLQRALLAWQSKRPRDAEANTNLPQNFVESCVARFWWPRRAWIPEA
jgi:tetratricopeptide (TPR) repeat protein